MYAYHIDRIGNLEVGQTIDIKKFNDLQPAILNSFLNERYPKGLSRHGQKYFAAPPVDQDEIPIHFYELIFEYERQLNFPKMPSRLQSFFACETLADIDIWIDFLNLENPRIVEVQYSTRNFKKLDARLINGEPIEKYSNIKEAFQAKQYWRGKFSDNPLPELLICGEIQVSKIIRD